MAAVAAKKDEFKKLGVQFLAISIDSVFVHKVWNEEELSAMVDGGFPFPMVSDASGEAGRLYGCYDEDLKLDLRGRFIIDPSGVLQAAEILYAPVGRNIEEIIRQVHAFQYVAKTGGAEATPAGWAPGKPTLKPGPDLVGKVCEEWNVDEAF